MMDARVEPGHDEGWQKGTSGSQNPHDEVADVGGMLWCAPPPPVDWIAMPVPAALTATPVAAALSEMPVALACDVATLAPPPTLSTNPNSEMLQLVVAPVEKFMLWVCV